jgi:hypothetical protein
MSQKYSSYYSIVQFGRHHQVCIAQTIFDAQQQPKDESRSEATNEQLEPSP